MRARPSGRELRLREFGSKQAAWVKLLPDGGARSRRRAREARARGLAGPGPRGEALRAARRAGPLHTLLRDQHVIAGIGRSWVDEILWRAQLSPYKRGADLDGRARAAEGRDRRARRGARRLRADVALPIPDKLPMPLRVHRHEGEPCPRCGTS